MFHRGDRVLWLDWVMGNGAEPSDSIGTVLYSYTDWNAPTLRSDSYSHAEDWRYARYIVLWDSGLMTHAEPQADLCLVFEGN